MTISRIQYKLDLCYIGSRYVGWQRQPNGLTVQQQLEKALSIILRQEVKVLGSSRTDTGVHAEHQVATFLTGNVIDLSRFLKSLNALLPEDVAVFKVAPVAEDFHPILSTYNKIYRYRIWCHPISHPFFREQVWHLPQTLDFDRMDIEAQSLLGRHDWTSFCASDSCAKSKVRTVTSVYTRREGPLWEFFIEGEGFLKQMVRTIVGTLVRYGLGRAESLSLNDIIRAEDRSQAGKTAPASGLTLVAINYDAKSARTIDDVLHDTLGGYSRFF